MNALIWILLSTFFISLISFIGILALSIKDSLLEKILLFMVALSAGVLIGDAFIHLIPEASELMNHDVFIYTLSGFVLFFIVEKVLHWRHCHEGKCYVHTFAYMNILGDVIHNFIDGLIIAASFVADFNLGIATTIAVAMHEIPQEIGDFGVLVYAKFKKIRALVTNFLTALTAIIGGIVGYLISGYVADSTPFLLSIAAGGFIYIAASDLIPEIRKELNIKNSLVNIAIFIIGILVMYILKFISF